MRLFVMLLGVAGFVDWGAATSAARESSGSAHRAAPAGRPGGYYGGGGYARPYNYNRWYGYGGVGIGFGFYGGYYPYPVGWYDTPWLYAAPSPRIVVVPPPEPTPGAPRDPNAPTPPNGTEPPQAAPNVRETGLKIAKLEDDGAAAKGLLRVGDIILGVGNTRVQKFDDLRAALAAAPATGEIQVVFINGESGKLEKLNVKLINGRIGASVEETPLPPPPTTNPQLAPATGPSAAPPAPLPGPALK